MGGKMKLSTKSTHRITAARKLFRSTYPKDKSPIGSSNLTFIRAIGTEEALFEVKTKNNSCAMVFYGSCITTYADDIDMYEDQGEDIEGDALC